MEFAVSTRVLYEVMRSLIFFKKPLLTNPFNHVNILLQTKNDTGCLSVISFTCS